MTPAIAPQPEQPLSQVERVVNVFTAPSKTFRDINRSASWWLPFLIVCITSVIFVVVVDKKIGFDVVTENQMRLNPSQSARLEQATPEQRQQGLAIAEKFTKGFSYGFPALALVIYLIMAAVLMASFNFGQGAQVRFGQSLAVVVYGNFVGITKSVLGIISILAGVSAEGFILQNPVATNPGYFLNPTENPALYALATSLDVVTIWTLVLVGLGFTCISKVKKGAALGIVFGWWALITLVQVGFAAMSS